MPNRARRARRRGRAPSSPRSAPSSSSAHGEGVESGEQLVETTTMGRAPPERSRVIGRREEIERPRGLGVAPDLDAVVEERLVGRATDGAAALEHEEQRGVEVADRLVEAARAGVLYGARTQRRGV